jgi:cell division protein FtsW
VQPRRRSQQSLRETPKPKPELDLSRKHRPDYWLVILCALLLGIGVVVVYAISPALTVTNNVSSTYYITKQILAIVLSMVAFVITAKVTLEWWRKSYKILLIVAGLATLLAIVLPVNPSYPAHRWVRLGSLSFQSVELLKFALVIWLANFLALRIKDGTITSAKRTLYPILGSLFVIGLVVAGVQSDLGSTGVMVAMMASMVFIAGLPLKRVMLIAGIIAIGLVLFISTTPYRRARLEAFLHPQSNCASSGYQACQALIAVGSGGVVGLGLGSSVQAYGYLPEAANDSIFAIYAEKFGFVGSIVLLIIFVAFFARMKSIAERSNDNFCRLLVIGVLSWLSVQAFINIGAMIGILPLKGITLPFISYGGTSVVFAASAVGLIFQISQYTSLGMPRVGTESPTRRVGPNSDRLRNRYES